MRRKDSSRMLPLLLALLPCAAARAQLSTEVDAHWQNPAGGDWFAPANWSSGLVPNNERETSHNAFIDLRHVGPYQVRLSRDAALNNLHVASNTATLAHTGGVLRVRGQADLSDGRFRLDGGTIRGGTWNIGSGEGAFQIGTSTESTLDGVTMNGDWSLTGSGARLNVRGGLTLNGNATLAGESLRFRFAGPQTISGGTLRLDPSTTTTKLFELDPGAQLTLASSLTVSGGRGTFYGSGTLTNHGTILSDAPSQFLSLQPGVLRNAGVIEARSGNVSSAPPSAPRSHCRVRSFASPAAE